MEIEKVHLFFEQSGTFKKAFQNLGIPAEDYDIQNEFGETNHITDLFNEIEKGYEGEPSIFDSITPPQLIMAFFPCIRFENQIMLHFRGQAYQQKDWTLEQKMEFDMGLIEEVEHMYKLVNKLFIICIKRKLRLILENPYSEEHFLRRYWCFLPAIIERQERERRLFQKTDTILVFELHTGTKHSMGTYPYE